MSHIFDVPSSPHLARRAFPERASVASLVIHIKGRVYSAAAAAAAGWIARERVEKERRTGLPF